MIYFGDNQYSTYYFDEYSSREKIVNRILLKTGNDNFHIIRQVRNNLGLMIFYSNPKEYYPPSVLSVNLDGRGDNELICLLSDSIKQINNIAVIDTEKELIHFAYLKPDNENPYIYSINHFPSKNMADWGVKVT